MPRTMTIYRKTMNKIEQVGGTHYQNEIQPWDEFKRLNVNWAQGEVTKYLCRWWKKGGIQDLNKALSIIRKWQSVQNKRDIRFIAYYPAFMEQYEKFYGEAYPTFKRLINRVLKEDWYVAETLMEEIITYFKEKGYE